MQLDSYQCEIKGNSNQLACSAGVFRVFANYSGINSPPPVLLLLPNTHSLGHLFVSPQASSEFESKMALAWSKCARSLAKIRLHYCRLVINERGIGELTLFCC